MLFHLLITIMTFLQYLKQIQDVNEIKWESSCLHENIVHLLSNHLRDDVSGMNVDGADGHDLLPIALCELPDQHGDEDVKLGHLFPIGLLEGIVIALIHAGKGNIYI